jgi:hypothetical protein
VKLNKRVPPEVLGNLEGQVRGHGVGELGIVLDLLDDADHLLEPLRDRRGLQDASITRPRRSRKAVANPAGCPFRKFDPAWIRVVRHNHRIIRADANRSTNQSQARKLFLILFNTLRRILQEYACYYNELRTHRSLNKDALIE